MFSGFLLADLPWQKATASTIGNCVELAPHEGMVMLRDSKDPNGPVLSFTKSEISAWLDGARKGEFDGLVR